MRILQTHDIVGKTGSITKGGGDFQIRLIYIVAAAPVDNVCLFCLSKPTATILFYALLLIYLSLCYHTVNGHHSIEHKRYVYYLPGGWLKLALYTMSHKMKSFNSI